MSTNTVYHTSYKRCLICLCFFLSWKNKEDDHKKNKKGTAKKNTKCCKTLQPVQEKAGHCTSLLTAPRTGIHFSKARTLLAHGDMVSLRHCENTLVLLRISESHTQCVIHKAVWCWLACYWIPHMAQWGDNSAEIVSISVKRSGLFIGIEEGEITERLPEDLPSGRDNSEPRSSKGCNAVFFLQRLNMMRSDRGSEANILHRPLCKGTDRLSKTTDMNTAMAIFIWHLPHGHW